MYSYRFLKAEYNGHDNKSHRIEIYKKSNNEVKELLEGYSRKQLKKEAEKVVKNLNNKFS